MIVALDHLEDLLNTLQLEARACVRLRACVRSRGLDFA